MSQRHRVIRLSDGTIVLDVVGGDPAGEDEEEDDDDLDNSEDEDEDEDDDSEEETVDTLKEKLAAAEEAARKATRRMKAADRAKNAEVKKRQELEAKRPNGKPAGDDDKSELEQKIADLQAQLDAKSKPDPQVILSEAFRDFDDIKWHDRKLAFQALDLSEVDVDDEGKFDPEALTDAIKDLAKARPYLVKKSETDDDPKDDDEDPLPRSGQQGGRKQRKSSTDRAVMEKKFPILNGR